MTARSRNRASPDDDAEWHFLKRNLFRGNALENSGLARDKLGLVHDPGLTDEEAAVAPAHPKPRPSPPRFPPP